MQAFKAADEPAMPLLKWQNFLRAEAVLFQQESDVHSFSV